VRPSVKLALCQYGTQPALSMRLALALGAEVALWLYSEQVACWLDRNVITAIVGR